jgi:hypothetical protein
MTILPLSSRPDGFAKQVIRKHADDYKGKLRHIGQSCVERERAS